MLVLIYQIHRLNDILTLTFFLALAALFLAFLAFGFSTYFDISSRYFFFWGGGQMVKWSCDATSFYPKKLAILQAMMIQASRSSVRRNEVIHVKVKLIGI